MKLIINISTSCKHAFAIYSFYEFSISLSASFHPSCFSLFSITADIPERRSIYANPFLPLLVLVSHKISATNPETDLPYKLYVYLVVQVTCTYIHICESINRKRYSKSCVYHFLIFPFIFLAGKSDIMAFGNWYYIKALPL